MSAKTKKAKATEQQIVEMEQKIARLRQDVKIYGTLDQDRNLILGEKELICEAVNRKHKIDKLQNSITKIRDRQCNSQINYRRNTKPGHHTLGDACQ